MIETIIFLTISLILFAYLFITNFKKRNKRQILFLIADIIIILIFFIYFLSNKSHNILIQLIAYIVSIIIPVIIIILNHYEYNVREGALIFAVNFILLFGNRALAKKIIFKFLKNRPHSYSLHKKLGDMYKEEGGIRKALSEYIIALNLKQVPSLYLEVAEMFYDLDNKEEAREALIYILSKEDDFLEAYIFLSQIYLESKQYKEAAKTLNDALKCLKDKGSYDIYYKLGEIHAKLNEFKESRSNFEKAYELNENSIIQLYIAQILLIENEEDKAIELFKELLDLEALKPYVLYELAKVAKCKYEPQKAISYINEAIKLEESLKERAFKEEMFADIRDEFILSVKLDKEEIENIKEKLVNQKTDKEIRKSILKNLQAHGGKKSNVFEKFKLVEIDDEISESEMEIIKHFSGIYTTITDMGDVTTQQKTKERVDRIFKEKLGYIAVKNPPIHNQENIEINEFKKEIEEQIREQAREQVEVSEKNIEEIEEKTNQIVTEVETIDEIEEVEVLEDIENIDNIDNTENIENIEEI